jgi:hypothetical protein
MKTKAALVIGVLVLGFFIVRPIVRHVRINRLVAELSTAPAEKQEELVLQLAREGPAAVAPLVEQLPNRNGAIELAIVQIFGKILPGSVFLACAMNCQTGYVEGQDEAEAAIDLMVPALIKCLQRDDPIIQEAALKTLTVDYGFPRIITRREDSPALVTAVQKLRQQGNPKVRLAAVQLIGAFPADQAIPLLLEAISDDDDAIRNTALKSLIPALAYYDSSSRVKGKAVPTLINMIGQSIDETTEGKNDIELLGPMNYHTACIDALAKLHATQEIARFLTHRTPQVQLHAAWQLFTLGQEQKAVDALITMSYSDRVGSGEVARILRHPMIKNHKATKTALKNLADTDPKQWQTLCSWDRSLATVIQESE